MKVLWFSVYHGWTLQHVQAVVNFVIDVLCVGGIFVLTRLYWVRAVRHVLKNESVLAHDLFTLNTVTETYDVAQLLGKDLLHRQFRRIFTQSTGVVMLTLVGFASAFIASASTRPGESILAQHVSGVLAQRTRFGLEYAPAEINTTYEALKQANFPPNQLLEFLPDRNDWVYDSKQWNSSWSMDCQFVRATDVPNPVATGNCSSDPILAFPEFPQLYDSYKDLLGLDTFYILPEPYGYKWYSRTGNSTFNWFMGVYGTNFTRSDQSYNLSSEMEVRIRIYYLQDVPSQDSSNSTCFFGTGPIGSVFFTGATCILNRDFQNRTRDDVSFWGANPDQSTFYKEKDAFFQYFGNRWVLEQIASVNFTVAEGEEMARFYQAYQIAKDANTGVVFKAASDSSDASFSGATRMLDVRVSVAEISTIWLVICIISLVLILVGCVKYSLFKRANCEGLVGIPQSKLDWMLLTLQQETTPSSSRPGYEFRYSHWNGSCHEEIELINAEREKRCNSREIDKNIVTTYTQYVTSSDDDLRYLRNTRAQSGS